MNYSTTATPTIKQSIANGQIPTTDIYVGHETTIGGYLRVITKTRGQRTGLRENSNGKTIDHSTWYMYILTPEGVNVSGKGSCSNSIKGYNPTDAPRANRLGFIYSPTMAWNLIREFGPFYNYRGYTEAGSTGVPGIAAPNSDVIFESNFKQATKRLERLENQLELSL